MVRSDTASAVQGLYFGRDFLIRMEAYGLDPTAYFGIINTRIDIAYRSFVSPGPGKDGQSVNARVPSVWLASNHDWSGCPGDVAGCTGSSFPCGLRPPGTKALDPRGSSTTSHPDGDRRRRTMAMARVRPHSDPRQYGRIGTALRPQPGDALAAIVGDPELDPELDDPRTAKYQWRGATFPWVYLPRRHDRCVRGGWSWCGSMHKSLALVPATEHPRRKGYNTRGERAI